MMLVLELSSCWEGLLEWLALWELFILELELVSVPKFPLVNLFALDEEEEELLLHVLVVLLVECFVDGMLNQLRMFDLTDVAVVLMVVVCMGSGDKARVIFSMFSMLRSVEEYWLFGSESGFVDR